MSRNPKQSSPEVAELAASILADKKASKIAKRLAGSVIAQAGTRKQTGAELEEVASKVMRSAKYSKNTKTLAASVLAQANKDR